MRDLNHIHTDSFVIGDITTATAFATLYAIQQKLITGRVVNKGAVNLTLTVAQSSDNGVGDAYAAINMRVNGANVASVVVVPGGSVVFALETTARTKNFLRFDATPMPGAVGELVLISMDGAFSLVASPGTAYAFSNADQE